MSGADVERVRIDTFHNATRLAGHDPKTLDEISYGVCRHHQPPKPLLEWVRVTARFALRQLREELPITKNGAEPLSSYPFEEDWL